MSKMSNNEEQQEQQEQKEGTQCNNGIILCGVCKNVASTLPVIRAAFEELVS